MNLGQGGDEDEVGLIDVRRCRRERESLDPSPSMVVTFRFAILIESP